MANTRITQGVIKPNENYDTHNIVSTGIVTAVGLDVNGNADISGSLSVGGVLTYEDVSSIDSVGIITAQKDIHVGAGVSAVGVGTFGGLVSPYADIDDFLDVGSNIKLGNAGIVTAAAVDVDDFLDVGSNIKLGNAGVITATSFVGSGAALTGIDATAIKDSGGNVKVQAQASGAMYTGIHTFSSGAEVGSNIKLGNAGVITATSFSGDGSNLTSLPAGLGTALSSTQSSPLNKIYYTNTVLPVDTTITVNPPASASAAYTQYADISVGSGADLIISDGDDLIPDVLGLRPDGTFGGGALGRMRVDKIVGKDANSAVSFEKGIVITGVTTSTTFSGSGASLTNIPSAQLTGALPALDGSNLTGITQTTINNNANNRVITGSGTANTLEGEANLTFDGTNLKIGNAGTDGVLRIRGAANSTQVSISDNTSATLRIKTASGALGQIFVESGQNLVLGTDNTERLRITSTGSVGIGTDNPLHDLEVYKVGAAVTATSVVRGEKAVLAIMGDATNTGASETDARLVFSSDGDVNPSKILTSPLSAHGFEIALLNEEPGAGLRFHDGTANAERLRIGSAGQIGLSGANYGTAGQALLSQGASSAPQWGSVSAGGASNIAFNSGNGISFAATGDGSGSASSEILDDYEEGTWTGSIQTGSANINNEWYVKIGSLVIGGGSISAFGDTSSGNIIQVNGLPYSNSGAETGTGAVAWSKCDASNTSTMCRASGSTLHFMRSSQSTGSWNYVLHSNMVQGSGSCTFGFNYITTS